MKQTIFTLVISILVTILSIISKEYILGGVTLLLLLISFVDLFNKDKL